MRGSVRDFRDASQEASRRRFRGARCSLEAWLLPSRALELPWRQCCCFPVDVNARGRQSCCATASGARGRPAAAEQLCILGAVRWLDDRERCARSPARGLCTSRSVHSRSVVSGTPPNTLANSRAPCVSGGLAPRDPNPDGGESGAARQGHLAVMNYHHQQHPGYEPVPPPYAGPPEDYWRKEEMSPSSGGMNGYFVDSFGDPKKKKGPAPRQQEELCLVCGDRASGYHYNALTCEGCKGFFRRSITKNAVYQCKYGNNCDIDMYMRRKCQECRLKKCLSVGMRPECVVPEYQCAIKRESKKHQKDRPNSTTRESPSGLMAPVGGVSPSSQQQPLSVGSGGSLSSNSGHEEDKKPLVLSPGVKPLSSSQEDLINKLVYYQQEFESPSEEDMKKTTPFPLGDSEEDNQRRFQHITEITILTVQLIVEFSKRVPGFDTLAREDQITLLKACSSEVMMLRGARKYDVKTDSIVFANNQPYTRDNYRSASVGDSADALFRFCRKMCQLRVDNAEYALLTAIVIFSERPSLVDPHKVERIQEYYIETLRMYSEYHRPPGKNYFARLLSILTELRTLGNMNAEMCFSLKVQNKKLPPFLAEIWDIQE